jgi:predicted phosphoadenosine phosphosulfate sulfurtransferase
MGTQKIEQYVRTWEKRCYADGIPDECPMEIDHLVPSYRKIALAILKNDYSLKSLGFTPNESIYYGILKRIEISERHKTVIQLKLFP